MILGFLGAVFGVNVFVVKIQTIIKNNINQRLCDKPMLLFSAD